MPAAAPHATKCRRCGMGILRILPTMRSDQGRKLNQRAFPSNRGSCADREESRYAFDDAGPDRNITAADDDGFHVVRGRFLPDAGEKTISEPKREAGQETAHSGHRSISATMSGERTRR